MSRKFQSANSVASLPQSLNPFPRTSPTSNHQNSATPMTGSDAQMQLQDDAPDISSFPDSASDDDSQPSKASSLDISIRTCSPVDDDPSEYIDRLADSTHSEDSGCEQATAPIPNSLLLTFQKIFEAEDRSTSTGDTSCATQDDPSEYAQDWSQSTDSDPSDSPRTHNLPVSPMAQIQDSLCTPQPADIDEATLTDFPPVRLAIFEHLLALEHRLRETEEEKVKAKEESSKLQADFLETEKKLSGSNRILAHAEVALEILKLA